MGRLVEDGKLRRDDSGRYSVVVTENGSLFGKD
jgi:hypothetical protein